MTVEQRCWGGGSLSLSHPLQLTTGLVINSSVTTSPTLAGDHMLLIPKVNILSEQSFVTLGHRSAETLGTRERFGTIGVQRKRVKESSFNWDTIFSSSGWWKRRELVPGATNNSCFWDSAMGHEAWARYDSRRLEVTKSVRPAATVVYEAKAANSAEIFLSNRAGSEGWNRASKDDKSQKHWESPAITVLPARSIFSRSANVTEDKRDFIMFLELEIREKSGLTYLAAQKSWSSAIWKIFRLRGTTLCKGFDSRANREAFSVLTSRVSVTLG